MTSITVGLEQAIATQLVEEARRVGMTPEQLVAKALEEFLSTASGEDSERDRIDPFAFIGTLSSDQLQGRRVDELLTKGFGKSRS